MKRQTLLTLKKKKTGRNHPFRVAKLPSRRVRAPRISPVEKSRAPNPEASGAVPTLEAKPVLQEPEYAKATPADSTQVPALQLYLREIGQVKLLTPKEEIELAKRIKKGDEQAREHMIKANLRLVVK